MTIAEFVANFKTPIDCIWVRDSSGNFITAPGYTKFTNVSIDYYGNQSLADVTFII